MKIGWQLTKLLQKFSGLLFLAHPVVNFVTKMHGWTLTGKDERNMLMLF